MNTEFYATLDVDKKKCCVSLSLLLKIYKVFPTMQEALVSCVKYKIQLTNAYRFKGK